MKQLPHKKHFFNHLLKNAGIAAIIFVVSLGGGVIGYHHFFKLHWVDSLYNASLILGGMGPSDVPPSSSAKVFASFYSLYSGVAFLSTIVVLFSPIYRRYLHKFHLDVED